VRPDVNRFPYGAIALLGAVTIAAYGAWHYAFGVLLDPILADTGWPESWVSGGFSLAVASGGLLAFPAGRFLDRAGSRPVFFAASVISTTALWFASISHSVFTFNIGSVVAGATLGSLGFYHITQTTAVRVAPNDPTRAIGLLTIIGAFSSAIYLPVAAVLVTAHGWRATIRILAITTGVVLVLGAFGVREQPAPRRPEEPDTRLTDAPARAEVRRYVAAIGCIGIAVGIILVYQVPLMTAAGLPLTAAAWMAGLRGAAQITGRIPLTWIIGRLGARRSLRMAFIATTAGAGLLLWSGSVVVAAAYALVAGFGIGATSPLQGIYADELFERRRLGAAMGAVTMVFGLASAAGPALVGVLADVTGSRSWGVIIGVGAGAMAAVFLRTAPTTAASRGAED